MQGTLTDLELRFLLDPEHFDPTHTEESAPEKSTAPGLQWDLERDLESSPEEGAQPAPVPTPGLSGDLQDLRLMDVLQTIHRAGLEGVLVVSNPLEEHHLWIRGGHVSDWVPSRVESRRLGRRLIRAGLITADQLDEAMRKQGEGKQPLGEILVRAGIVTHAQIEETARDQALEDLYSLFVWTEGTVVFNQGHPEGEELQALESLPSFEVDGVIAEAERRQPEWEQLLANLGSLHEILVKRNKQSRRELPETHEKVLRALDGKTSLLDISKSTMLGLFDCARAVKDLYEWQMIDVAPVEELLDLARAHVAKNERTKAVVILRNLIKRGEVSDLEFVRSVVEVLVTCKETKSAAELLIKTAHGCSFAEERLQLAREAYAYDPRSSKTLAYLRDRLLEAAAPQDELLPIACALSDAMVADGWFEEALEVITAFPTTSPDETPALTRRVRLLVKIGRSEEAVWELLELVNLCKQQGRTDLLPRIYEQILRIDPAREDIAAALRSRRQKKKLSRRTMIVAAVVAVALIVLGGMWSRSASEARRLSDWLGGVRERLTRGDPEGALQALRTGEEYLRLPEAAQLKQQIDDALAQAQEKREQQFLQRLGEAAEILDHGDVARALATYDELLRDAERAERVTKAIEARFGSMAASFTKLAATLPGAVPPPPDTLDTNRTINAALEDMNRAFLPGDLALARGLLAVEDHALMDRLVGAQRAAALREAARSIVAAFDQAEQRRALYDAARQTDGARRRLEGLWTAAQQHEKDFEIAKAFEIYERLARDYPDDKDGLRKVFETKRDRYGALEKDLERLQEATERGELDQASRLLSAMKRREPDVPLDELVRLPLRVESTPTGARVLVDDEQVGTTPVVTSYRPAGEPHIRVELPGFEPVVHTVTNKVGLLIKVVLVRTPSWTRQAKGVMERRAACDSGNVMYAVDRSGRLSAVRTDTGIEIWSKVTGDLSGLLPTPVLWRDRVVLTSLDGPLRCLLQANVRQLWEIPSVPCEWAPALVDHVLVAGTTDGVLLGLDLATDGKVSYRTPLPGPISSDVQIHGDRVVVTTGDGWVVCAEGKTGRIVWKFEVGSGVVAAPAVSDDLVVVGGTDGRLVALRAQSGEKVWETFGLGEVLYAPVFAAGRVVVATGDRLLAFDLGRGQQRATYQGAAPWSASPVVAGDNILVGDRRGVVTVVGASALDLRYQLHGESAVAGPVTVTPDGKLVVGFENRTVRCYTPP